MFRVNSEDGFTMIEAIAALVISVLLFVMLAQTLGGAFRSSHDARANQTATLLGNEYVELARSLEWDELAMTSVVAADARVKGSDKLDKAASDLPADEKLVVDAAGLIEPQVDEVVDNETFVVWQYVTEVDSDLRRVVVFVAWESGSTVREHHTSAVISKGRELSEKT